MSALCLLLAGHVLAARLETDRFTLSWVHSIEKIEWQEDWQVTADGLEIVEARVAGSGAGMDVPADARRIDGGWTYRPALPRQREVHLARSGLVPDYRLCVGGNCAPLGRLAGGIADGVAVTLAPCGP
ncbi:DUF1850 domain-containing protein [Zavarzinia aquatilis]|uniref:DUF1850 domain-containing protein n=1 Tax=Zavarzinia aquatilis TaxID=2211142 RepID=A0A317EDL3_9PROT|nr:DUF1850 domain-containing protein [Zavarzinia aquatilis]PWR25118.1 DUF1850 domain-containing protein [Zavarzinia aquatilis]